MSGAGSGKRKPLRRRFIGRRRPPRSPEQLERKALVRRFWRSARGFWTGEAKAIAWWMTAGLLVVTAIQLWVQFRINVWNREIFDAIEQKDSAAVLWQAMIFVPLGVGGVALAILSVYGRMRTQRRWRAFMTDHLLDRWLDKGRYYQLNFVSGNHENPEGRIAEDARVATDAPIDFGIGILSAAATAFMFMGVLWGVGGALTIRFGETSFTIPGYLFIAVVIYAAMTSTAMLVIGRTFVPAAERKNQSEAEFRYLVTRLRENGESIALLSGEQEERAGLRIALRDVIGKWGLLARQYMRNTFVTTTNFLIAPVIPIILCAPKYLADELTLGQVMQAAAAFVQVQASFNWLTENYPRLAEWAASAQRVASLLLSLDRLDQTQARGVGEIRHVEHDGAAIRLVDLSVTLSDGTVVVDQAEIDIDFGERVLVTGESGSGKSTLVRAIAGLWPWGDGEVLLKRGARLFLMPQRPYIPLGTLRRAATYPMAADAVSDEVVCEALRVVGLPHLIGQLDVEGEEWHRVLSGGEQQRLAFARLLIQKPDIVVMDEATSALDPESQSHLLKSLLAALPNTTIVSVGHRPELEEFHERKITLARREGGARLVSDEQLAPHSVQRLPMFGRIRRRKA